MMAIAKQNQVDLDGLAAVDPGNDVVRLGPAGGTVAPRPLAALVAVDKRPPQGGGGNSHPLTNFQHRRIPGEKNTAEAPSQASRRSVSMSIG